MCLLRKGMFRVFCPHCLNGIFLNRNCIRLVCEKLTVYGQYIVGNICSLAFRRVGFEIEVGVTRNLQKCNSNFDLLCLQAARVAAANDMHAQSYYF